MVSLIKTSTQLHKPLQELKTQLCSYSGTSIRLLAPKVQDMGDTYHKRHKTNFCCIRE